MRFLNFSLLLLLLCSCSTGAPQKKDKEHTPLHSGVVIAGKYFHIEIVGTHQDVKIYPYQADDKGVLQPLDTHNVKLSVEYSPYRSKADYDTYMVRKKEHFWGEINDRNEKGYQIYIKLKFDGHTDRFVYVVRPKA